MLFPALRAGLLSQCASGTTPLGALSFLLCRRLRRRGLGCYRGSLSGTGTIVAITDRASR